MKTKSEILQGTKEVLTSKFADRNTLLIEYANGSKAYRLHSTDVVTVSPKKVFTLNSSGWRTATTKERINKFSPAKLYQNKGLWYIGNSEFYDGIKVDSNGIVISRTKTSTLPKVEAMKKKIKNFCDLITADNLPLPSSGDCWDCFLHNDGGKPLGELRKDDSHILQHIKEEYIHGSLLVNAMREAGYNDIRYFYSSKVVKSFKKALSKYLQKRLIGSIAIR